MPFFSNDTLDDQLTFERIESFSGGEDSFRRSTLLNPDQSQHLLNVIIRDNFEARTRPGADALAGGTPPDSANCRGLLYYNTPLYSQILAAFNQKIWKYEGNAWSQVAGFLPADNRLAIAQGVDTALISDGQNNMRTYDGVAFTDCGNAETCPPVGATILTWHTGRMFASGIATLSDTIYVSNRLAFGAGQWNPTTRSFRVGDGDGEPITAMAPMQGFVLCVFKSNSIWLVATDPRNEPADFSATQNSEKVTDGIGCVGRDAWCAYGNDILFMAQDGVRSVQRMQAAAGQWQLTAPISQPIQPYIDRINRGAWDKIVAIKYQEFAFFFVPLDISTTNNCVLVYNGRLGHWSGAWTGWNGQAAVTTRFSGSNHMVFGDLIGQVNQWKDQSSLTDDTTYQDNGTGYATQVWPRSFLFQEPVNNKSAYNIELRFSSGNAQILVTVVADNSAVQTFGGQAAPSGDILGVDILPFLLASTVSLTLKKGVRSLSAFNECFLKIETTTGWIAIKNITMSAFINPLKGQ